MVSSISKGKRVSAHDTQHPSRSHHPAQVRRDWARCRVPTTTNSLRIKRWRTLLDRLRRYCSCPGEVKLKRAGFGTQINVNRIVFPPFTALCFASVVRTGNGTDGVTLRRSAGHHATSFPLTRRPEKAMVQRVSRRRRTDCLRFEATQPQGTVVSALDYRRFRGALRARQ